MEKYRENIKLTEVYMINNLYLRDGEAEETPSSQIHTTLPVAADTTKMIKYMMVKWKT